MNKKYIIGLVVVVILVVGYFFLREKGPTISPSSNSQASEQIASLENGLVPTQSDGQVIITFTDSGFSLDTVTIKKGESVTWVNQSNEGMWVASAAHPTHIVYSGTALNEHCPDTADTAFDQCGTGNSYTFTFDKTGTWKYHNHVDASKTGTIVVTE